MALKISRKMPFGSGSRGFRFRNHADDSVDHTRYQEGRTLEEERFRTGSVAEKIYQRLSAGNSTHVGKKNFTRKKER